MTSRQCGAVAVFPVFIARPQQRALGTGEFNTGALAWHVVANGGAATAAKTDVTSKAEWTGLIGNTLATDGRLDLGSWPFEGTSPPSCSQSRSVRSTPG